MHSRIFQIERNPISEEEWIGETEACDFVDAIGIADYADSDLDGDSVQFCKEDLCKIFHAELEADGSVLVKKDTLTEYLDEKHRYFKDLAQKASIMPFEEFTKYCNTLIFELKAAYDDEYGYYVYSSDGYFETFDSYVRRLYNKMEKESVNEVRLYLGNVLDYHF